MSIHLREKFTDFREVLFMFSELLRELRSKKGVTQVELAKAIGVSNGNVGDWERGRSKPGYEALVALARYFEIDAGRLLELPPLPSNPPTCDGVPLSQLEADFLAMFRLLPPDAREEIFDLVHFKYKRIVEQKKESIFWTYFDENDGSDDGKSGPAEGRKTRDGTA
jgi:transcriptional regulator with XRE-family HTH domain